MKRIFFAILTILAFQVSAQDDIRWGFSMGTNFSNSYGFSNGDFNTGDYKHCLTGTLFIESPLSYKTIEQIYIGISERGSRSSSSFGGTTYTGKSSALYAVIGNKQKIMFADWFYMFISEYVELGIIARSSNSVNNTVYNMYKGDKKLKNRRLSAGGSLGIGVTLWNHFFIEPEFTFSLTNLSRQDKTFMNYFGLVISGGYKF